jgi:hypothetical protein
MMGDYMVLAKYDYRKLVLAFSFLTLNISHMEAQAVDIQKRRSLMITNIKTLDELSTKYDFGFLLGRSGVYSQNQIDDPQLRQSPGAFVENIFSQAYREQIRHERLDAQIPQWIFYEPTGHFYAETPLGPNPWRNRYMDAVFRNWMPADRMKSLSRPQQLRGGPFRLLAIANRMDMAGEFDDRINNEATSTPRTFGEIHLIYALVDDNFERIWGTPFPMTFELSYRLPSLRRLPQQGIVRDVNSPTWDEFASNEKLWQKRMQIWAELWANLSRITPGTEQFRNAIDDILALSLTPENFISIRSNTQITGNHHELREWYVVQSNRLSRGNMLVTRKPRREPYRCLDGSLELAAHIQHYWDRDHQDLDMSTRNPAAVQDQNRAGYAILRDHTRNMMRNFVSDDMTWSQCAEQQLTTARHTKYIRFPHQMLQSLNSDNDDPRERLLLLAPSAVLNPKRDIWTMADLTSKGIITEWQRHAFAIRTCSGCHSTEGASLGFHIAPRSANLPAQLSPFLVGGPQAEFTFNKQKYKYDVLSNRKDLLEKYLKQEAKLFEGLYLSGFHRD